MDVAALVVLLALFVVALFVLMRFVREQRRTLAMLRFTVALAVVFWVEYGVQVARAERRSWYGAASLTATAVVLFLQWRRGRV
jgi:hypothetical protein